jgi:putative glutamine amidotransferase
MKSSKAIIGIIPDYKEGSKEGYSIKPYYALRCNYTQMISNCGGAPVILSYDYDLIDDYIALLDGIMVVGGYFDIHPKRYGEEKIHPTVKLNLIREDFEHQIISKALKTNIPILGICNGMQLINVLHGGKIIQHITDDKTFINHEQSHDPEFNDYNKAYHEVKIEPQTKLHQIIGQELIKTNSSHQQAAKNVGSQVKISARASDGIIEAIEKIDHPFCIGIQWHPEFNIGQADHKIFAAFVAASKKYKDINDRS